MSRLVRVKGSLAALGGSPAIQQCFTALEFDWKQSIPELCRPFLPSTPCEPLRQIRGRRGSEGPVLSMRPIKTPPRPLGAARGISGFHKGCSRWIYRDTVTAAAVLKDCHRQWLALCKRWHPDAGGDDETMAMLNAAWSRIEALFARKGIRLD